MNTKSIALIGKESFIFYSRSGRNPTFIQAPYHSSFILPDSTVLASLNDDFPELDFGVLIFQMIDFPMTVVSHPAFLMLCTAPLTKSGAE
jgi:hypothetical protein